jgi:hypothetical protein
MSEKCRDSLNYEFRKYVPEDGQKLIQINRALRIDSEERSGVFDSERELTASSLVWLDMSKTLAGFTSLAICTRLLNSTWHNRSTSSQPKLCPETSPPKVVFLSKLGKVWPDRSKIINGKVVHNLKFGMLE